MALRTSDVSGVAISVHDDKDAADRALVLRDNHQINKGLADIFANEGTVGVFYGRRTTWTFPQKQVMTSQPYCPARKKFL